MTQPSEIKNLTAAIKAEARQLGFQLVGVTTPDPPPHLNTYLKWLEKGHHGGMSWMATDRARERRADILKILPSCKSILVLGIRYPKPDHPAPPSGIGSLNRADGRGKVASYALGDDYHDVLPERLRAIVSFLEAKIGKPIPHRWYTDTGPILERELAQRAGLGWIGKNTCLINPKMGSYFLLAEILLGIELEPDDPVRTDHCGSCTRCIDECPTSCILPDRTIDANRCISYLTIEHRGTIPQDLRTDLGSWIFGCDICQQVCPWNQKFASDEYEEAFSARPSVPPESLKDELSLSVEAFNRKFKGSPIKRAKRRGYLRNVALAIGNQASSEAVPVLIAALKDDEALIRSHAAWALSRTGTGYALQALENALENETDSDVILAIKAGIKNLEGEKPLTEI
jgi:epoxyqueuosine reductase